MTENPKLVNVFSEDMLLCDFEDKRSNYEARESSEEGGHKTRVPDVVRGRTKSNDSLVVDVEGLSQLIETDINANSRITRNLTRKVSVRGGDKKINGNERDTSLLSPRATLYGGSTPEKSVGVAMGANNHASVPEVHHQITITSGCVGGTAAESKYVGKRFGFRRSSNTWIIDSRRILLFFATLSCVGTILLIYFTLSMRKLGEEDNVLN